MTERGTSLSFLLGWERRGRRRKGGRRAGEDAREQWEWPRKERRGEAKAPLEANGRLTSKNHLKDGVGVNKSEITKSESEKQQ